MTNHTGCKLPWVDYVEENDTNVDLVILVCLLLTLLFDIFLIAIILAHEDLRKQVTDLKLFSSSIIRLSLSEGELLHDFDLHQRRFFCTLHDCISTARLPLHSFVMSIQLTPSLV